MQCPQCHVENREARHYCAECGTRLTIVCAQCAFANDPGEKFCGGCGRPIVSVDTENAAGKRPTEGLPSSGASVLQDTHIRSRATGQAERRQLTVMFCDLVGSTALSYQLDPEALRDVMRSYQDAVGEVVEQYDGFVAKFLGDGILVYFGYPHAHEDDAIRAIHTGLDIVKTFGRLNAEDKGVHGAALAVRIGIATGLVVVGDLIGKQASEQAAVIGETPNLAARLQGIAEPNCIVIAERTRSLAGTVFEYLDAGTRTLKGLPEPVRVWQVAGESAAESRFEATAERGLMPLVGREREIEQLLECWAQAKNGTSQVVLLAGEGGIGKSRIVRAFQARVENELPNRVLYYGSPYHKHSAFYPVIDQLQRALRWEKDDTAVQQADKLEAALRGLKLDLATHVPPLASLLSLPVSDRYPSPIVSPGQLKKNIVTTLVAIAQAMAAQQAVLMIVEDVHWIDPSTLELLNVLIEQLRSARFLLLLTSRPEFEAPWKPDAQVTALVLNRMSRADTAAMVAKVTAGKSLPTEVLDQIITKTDGVPLFVEELTKTVLESDLLRDAGARYVLSGPLGPLAIPASLQDSLMARLDRLATTKDVAQLAATIGRTFSLELLAAVSPLQRQELEHALTELMQAELVYRRGFPPDATYEFKHALVQDAAYQSLLKSKRQQYHQRIAQVLEEQFPDTAETAPEILAHHYTEAHLLERAIGYWLKAGPKALGSSANLEAIEYLNTGLKLLKTLPDTPERAQQELKLQMTLAVPLTATSGYAIPEVEQTYKRARELCAQMGKTPHVFPALQGMWRYHWLRAEHGTAHELARELLALADKARDRALLMAAHRTMGVTLFCLGDLSQSQAHLEQAVASQTSGAGEPNAQGLYDMIDPQVAARSYVSWVLWLLGYPDQARAESRDTVALAEAASHPFSVAMALCYAAWLRQFGREPELARQSAEAALALCTERGFPFWIGWADVLAGWATSKTDPGEGPIARMRRGLTQWRVQGCEVGTAYFQALLADAYRRQGAIEEGLRALAEAQAFVDKTGECYWQAEQHRLKGELLLKHPKAKWEDAESCFQQALDIARSQHAKALELRAATSLARVWTDRGERGDARELLTPIYGWFSEGFDTVDLKAAHALLHQLA